MSIKNEKIYGSANGRNYSAGHGKEAEVSFGKKAMPILPTVDRQSFGFGKHRLIRKGSDVAIIATGEAVFPALLAAEKIKRDFKPDDKVVNMQTIKPLDHKLLTGIIASRITKGN